MSCSMKKLYLIRHAKSSWKEEGLSDFDRPLKGRGVRDAHNSGQWLLQQGEVPELIISSPATRAMHTALIFAQELHYPMSDIQMESSLYLGSIEDVGAVLAKVDASIDSVFLFGHNPTITNFVNRSIDHNIDNVPTTGVACLSFDSADWQDLGSEAELVFFDYPKRRKSWTYQLRSGSSPAIFHGWLLMNVFCKRPWMIVIHWWSASGF